MFLLYIAKLSPSRLALAGLRLVCQICLQKMLACRFTYFPMSVCLFIIVINCIDSHFIHENVILNKILVSMFLHENVLLYSIINSTLLECLLYIKDDICFKCCRKERIVLSFYKMYLLILFCVDEFCGSLRADSFFSTNINCSLDFICGSCSLQEPQTKFTSSINKIEKNYLIPNHNQIHLQEN